MVRVGRMDSPRIVREGATTALSGYVLGLRRAQEELLGDESSSSFDHFEHGSFLLIHKARPRLFSLSIMQMGSLPSEVEKGFSCRVLEDRSLPKSFLIPGEGFSGQFKPVSRHDLGSFFIHVPPNFRVPYTFKVSRALNQIICSHCRSPEKVAQMQLNTHIIFPAEHLFLSRR